MRTTKGVRKRLERAAAKSGRSLAQEVEWRLERFLDFDQHLVVACLAPPAFALLKLSLADKWLVGDPLGVIG